jgi:phenylacetate-CoA oxygenase PaaH subunit
MTDTQWPVYQVFERPAIGRPMRAAGSVHAADAEMALQNAWAVYGRRPTAVALWVVPRSLVLMRSREELSGDGFGTLSHSDGLRRAQSSRRGQGEGCPTIASDRGIEKQSRRHPVAVDDLPIERLHPRQDALLGSRQQNGFD